MAEILIVEDETVISMNAEMFLLSEGHTVVETVNNGRAALEILKTVKPDLVLMDIVLHGDISGIETTREINRLYGDIRVAYMTAHSDQATRQQIDSTRHVGVLFKPFNISQFDAILESIGLSIR